jgi:ABC-type tungstate transport system permease subunit
VEFIKKAKVLMDVILESSRFHEYHQEVAYNYFWVVSDYLDQAHVLSEALLNTFLQQGISHPCSNAQD